MPAVRRPTTPEGALLLALFAAPDADHTAGFQRLSEAGWHALADLAESRRGDGLLRRAVQLAENRITVPAPIAHRLEATVRQRTFDALRQAEALRRVTRLLASHGIMPIALKGVRLAWKTYPAPALRPMRDLDLLLPADQVEAAEALLLSRPEYVRPTWAGRYGIEYGHQLPEIVDCEADVVIELHHRLNARGWAEEARLVDLMTATSEVIDIGGRPIRVPSAHANVLHLIEHATLHHVFDNGPVVLADLHFALGDRGFDWPLLLAQATELGLTRALALLGAVAARHGARWPEAADLGTGAQVTARQLDSADVALLRTASEREQLAFLRRLETRTDAAPGARAALRALLHPNSASLAEIAGTAPASPWRWLAYPTWLIRRMQTYLATRDARKSGESSRQVRLLEWLQGR